jgi:hypothetical protein
LRRQADVPVEPDIPYGKVRRSRIRPVPEEVFVSENDDIGLTKLDFTSPPVTLTWLDLQAKAPPQDKGLKRTLTKLLCPSKEVGKSKVLLKGGKNKNTFLFFHVNILHFLLNEFSQWNC